MQGMQGHWALVTGAGGEIGAETALHLGKAGVNVVLADLSAERAEQAAHAVEAAGVTARAMKLDVGNFDEVSARVQELEEDWWSSEVVANWFGPQPHTVKPRSRRRAQTRTVRQAPMLRQGDHPVQCGTSGRPKLEKDDELFNGILSERAENLRRTSSFVGLWDE